MLLRPDPMSFSYKPSNMSKHDTRSKKVTQPPSTSTSPSKPSQEAHDTLLQELANINATLKEVKSSQTSMETKLDYLVQRLDKHQAEISDLKDSANFLSTQIDELTTAKSSMSSTITSQQQRISALENQLDNSLRYSRGVNLRFLDIPEANGEDCIGLVQELIKDVLGFQADIENAHRSGKVIPGKPRHIITKFLRRPQRFQVLRQRSLFFNKGFRVFEDLIHKDLQARRSLKHVVEEARENGKKTRFVNGSLYIDGKAFVPPGVECSE